MSQNISPKQGQNIDVLSEFKRVLTLESDSIRACCEKLSHPVSAKQVHSALEQLYKTLDRGGKIVVTGVGKSGKIAQKIAATLSSTGSLAVYLHPTEGLHGDLGILRPADSVLALSYTGNTEELLKLIPSIKALGVPMIGIGGNAQSTLAKESAHWIDASVEQEACPHNLAPTSSTTLALAIGDAFAIALMRMRGFDSKDFAQNHPGGSLGRKLNLTVGDVMHQGSALATVSLDSTMEEIIVRSTEKKLGAVLVIAGPLLKGIITDGDLRRALQHKEKFFNFKASDVMTRMPITASAEMMATEAVHLMESRESQISVLPVVDTHGNWKGLVRLHDLVRTF